MDSLSKRKKSDGRVIASLTFLLICFVGVIGYLSTHTLFHSQTKISFQKSQKKEQTQKVLGYSTPQLYVSGGEQGYSGGGMIALASTDEPAVEIGSYNITGQVEVSVYESNEQMLLDYLTHTKDGIQTKKNPDISNLKLLGKTTTTISEKYGKGNKVSLPIGDSGIYYLRLTFGSTSENSFVIRSKTGALVKEGDNEFIFWGQDFPSRRSVTDGTIILYNLQDDQKILASTTFDSTGIGKTQLYPDADIALIKRGDDEAVIPVNLKYLNIKNYYSEFQAKQQETKFFVFTDRPIYKPGDTVYFKSILRNDDDARYTIPQGLASVTVSQGYGDVTPLFQQSFPVSADGTVSGQFTIPADVKVGYYSFSLSLPGSENSGYTYFTIDYYRKPEYFVDVQAPKNEYISGEKASFTVSGNYFSGQPLANQQVAYKVYAGTYYSYEYLMDQQVHISDDYRYGYYGSDVVTQGTVKLDQQGRAEVPLDTRFPGNVGSDQVYSIEATIDDGSETPAFSRKNILVYAGDYELYRKDYSYYFTKVQTPLSLPITLISHKKTPVSRIALSATIHRESWIPVQNPDQKYPSYVKQEEELPSVSAQTDMNGNAVFTFTPQKVGYYTLTVSGHDASGNLIKKLFYSYVSSDSEPYYFSANQQELTITGDKKIYQPTDTAHLTIASATGNRDLFLSLDRARVNRYQIVHMDGNRATVDIPLVTTDIPNIYATISSFSPYTLDTGQTNLSVSTESKELHVQLLPDRKTYGPSDTATVQVKTSDVSGNPVSADVALWGVDKAIYELVSSNTGKIFDMFWSERYDGTALAHSLESITALNAEMGGGCFAEGTMILMQGSIAKAIQDVHVGDSILTKEKETSTTLVPAKVTGTHKEVVPGYFIFNNRLRVTSYHKLYVNNTWREASTVQIGDALLDSSGKKILVQSIEWVSGKFTVYNLTVATYNTFFANGIYVHNQKGGGGRSTFKDTAYWNPSVHTDATGVATVRFKLPDNLTTWVLTSIGDTTDTRVGQTETEIVVTKDVIVRPVLPNILRIGDTVQLSALVQNFTDHDETFNVDLGFSAGDVLTATHSGVLIKSKEMQLLTWNVSPKTQTDLAKLRFSARASRDPKISDTITQTLPVKAFGFSEQRAETGNGEKTYALKLAEDSLSENSSVTLSLSPTLLGTLPSAMRYLVEYPYGCVEQTTSRFVPALIAKSNSDLFKDSLSGKDIDDILQKGVERLSSLQHSDGGWPWWFGDSDPFITSYVVENLLLAKDLEVPFDQGMLKSAQQYLEQDQYYDQNAGKTISYGRDDIVAKTYGLTLLNSSKRKKHLSDLKGLTPDLLALAVMANYKNGDTNSKTNGLDQLIALAQKEGDSVFWKAGGKLHFASDDGSTALAMRAILMAKGDTQLAVKAARYLTRHRKYNYWDNTFATVQVVRAVVDLAKGIQETQPNYSYSILLDGKTISSGTVTTVSQNIKDISIPVNTIKKTGSTLSLKQSGSGQLYSTLLINEFHTDAHAKALQHGISIKRSYVNEKGQQYSLGIGDTVDVELEVSGLQAFENYAVVTDELPAGLVPINETFKNEQGGNPYGYYYWGDGISEKAISQNGVVLTLYTVSPVPTTYTYRARVVSAGAFSVPPATVSLMYAPEIYGRSEVDQITIGNQAQIIPGRIIPGSSRSLVKGIDAKTSLLIILLLFLSLLFMLHVKGISLRLLWNKVFSRKQVIQPIDTESENTPHDEHNA